MRQQLREVVALGHEFVAMEKEKQSTVVDFVGIGDIAYHVGEKLAFATRLSVVRVVQSHERKFVYALHHAVVVNVAQHNPRLCAFDPHHFAELVDVNAPLRGTIRQTDIDHLPLTFGERLAKLLPIHEKQRLLAIDFGVSREVERTIFAHKGDACLRFFGKAMVVRCLRAGNVDARREKQREERKEEKLFHK